MNQPEHYYKPGQSGNPSGRPKGAVTKVTIMRNKLAAGDVTIIPVLLAKAAAGDPQFVKMWLDKVLPHATTTNMANITIPIDTALLASARPQDQLKMLLDLLNAGELDLDQFAVLSKALAGGNKEEFGLLLDEMRKLTQGKS